MFFEGPEGNILSTYFDPHVLQLVFGAFRRVGGGGLCSNRRLPSP